MVSFLNPYKGSALFYKNRIKLSYSTEIITMMRSLLLVVCTALLSCDSGLTVEVTYNDTVISNPLDYCFVNNDTVREKTDSKAQLTIVEDDGDWIVISNGTTDLLLLTTNVTDCKVYNPSIILYAVQTAIECIIILSAASTIALHLCLKSLRNDFGVLVMIMCFFVILMRVVTLAQNQYQFTKVNDQGYICAVMVNTKLLFIFFYHSSVITIYFHFALLMYKTYKLRAAESDINTKLLCKYFAFIILLTVCIMSPIIVSDVMFSRATFATDGGYCAIQIESSVTLRAVSILVILVFLVQMVMFGAGMLLYLMVSRSFCEIKRTDVKVILALVSTSGLSAVLFLVSFFMIKDRSTSVPLLVTSVGILAEQLLLLILLCKKAITLSGEEISTCKTSCLHRCVHV